MELRDFIYFCNHWRRVIFSTAFCFGLSGFGLALVMPPQYEAQLDLYVYRVPSTSQEEFTYEGYYAQQSSKELADTVVGLLQSVHTAQMVLSKEGAVTESASVFKLTRQVKARVVANGVVRLSLKQSSPDAAQSLVKDLVSSGLRILNDHLGDQTTVVKVTALGEPLVKKIAWSPYLCSLSFFFLGGLLIVGFLSFRSYLHNSWVKRELFKS